MGASMGTSYWTISAYCAQKKAAICRSFNSLHTALGDLNLPSSISTPSAAAASEGSSSGPGPDLEYGHQVGEQNIHLQPGELISSDVHHVNYASYHFDWAAVIVAFCLTSAVEIALQSLQPQIKLPLLMHLLSLAMLFAFASAFVSNFISPTFSNFRRALMMVAKLSIFTAFLFALTVPFPLSLKLMSWSVFGLCLVIIGVFAAAATRRVSVGGLLAI